MNKLLVSTAAVLMSLLIAAPAFAADHVVTIKGMKFAPAELQVAVGDTVTFTNEDAAPHTATASDGSFDTGRLSRGQSATVTIESAGTFAYICTIHPAMKGTIVAN